VNAKNSDISSILENLEEIRFLLEAHLRISLPSPVHSELVGEQKDVFELCDFSRNSQDIAKELQKPGSQIRKTLTRLKRKGCVTSVKRGNSVYYGRIVNIETKLQNRDEE